MANLPDLGRGTGRTPGLIGPGRETFGSDLGKSGSPLSPESQPPPGAGGVRTYEQSVRETQGIVSYWRLGDAIGAPVAFRSAGAAAAAASGDVVPALPGGWQADDIFILVVSSKDTSTVEVPAGWTKFVDLTGSGNRAVVAYRRAVAGDTDPTVTYTGGNAVIAQIAAFSGCVRSGSPIDVSGVQANASSTLVTAPTITPTVADTMVVFTGHIQTADTQSGYSGANPTFAEAFDSTTTLGTDTAIALAYGLKNDTTATGARTSDLQGPRTSFGALFALKPQNAADQQRLNNGSYVGSPASVPGLVYADEDSAVDLNGTTQYITIPDNASLKPTEEMSIEAWVKPASISAVEAVVVRKGSEYIMERSTDSFSCMFKIGGTIRWIQAFSALEAGKTYHLVSTFKSGEQKIYLNGVEVASAAFVGALTTGVTPLYIGSQDTGSGDFWDGVLDEVAIYNVALPSQAVTDHFYAGRFAAYRTAVLEDQPALYWRLSEVLGTTALDETTNNRDGTYAGAFTLAQAGALAGDADTAVDLAGGDVTSTYTPFAVGSKFSVEGWAWRDTSASFDSLFGGDSGGSPILRLGSGSADVSFYSNSNFSAVSWTAAWPGDAQWVHWVLTFDDATNTAELFINGVSKGTRSQTTALGAPTVNFKVGARLASTDPFDGKLDEIAFYEAILPAARIRAHYYAGLPSLYRSAVLGSDPALYWRLGESSVLTAEDETANDRDGSYGGTLTLGVAGALIAEGDGAVDLDGSSGYIEGNGYVPFTTGSALSFEGWAWRDTSSGIDALFGGNGAPHPILRLESGLNDVRWQPRSDSSASTWVNAWPGNAQWVHWVLTHDESADVSELFINGVSQGTKSESNNYSNPGGIVVGCRSYTDWWDGKLDEFAVYERVLTAGEVLAHYLAADQIFPIVTITIAPNTSRISRVTGKDITTFGFQVDESYQAYKLKAVPSDVSPHTAGTLIEAGAGGSASIDNFVDVTDDELVNAGLGEATHMIKVFAQDLAGNWSN